MPVKFVDLGCARRHPYGWWGDVLQPAGAHPGV